MFKAFAFTCTVELTRSNAAGLKGLGFRGFRGFRDLGFRALEVSGFGSSSAKLQLAATSDAALTTSATERMPGF